VIHLAERDVYIAWRSLYCAARGQANGWLFLVLLAVLLGRRTIDIGSPSGLNCPCRFAVCGYNDQRRGLAVLTRFASSCSAGLPLLVHHATALIKENSFHDSRRLPTVFRLQVHRLRDGVPGGVFL
jgi:hypothetical protein